MMQHAIDYGTVDALANYWLRHARLGPSGPPAEYNLAATGASEALYNLLMSRPDVNTDIANRVLERDGFGLGLRLAAAIISDPHTDPGPAILPEIDDAIKCSREQILEEAELDAQRSARASQA